MQRLKNYSYETKQFKQRMLKATVLITILLSLLIGRLFNLQIFNYKRYAGLAVHNQLMHIPIEPNRGLIYDRHGVLLAENLPIFSLDMMTEYVKDLETTLTELKTIINITPHDLQQFKKSLRRRRHFDHLPLKLKLTSEEVATFYVNQYRFPGVSIHSKMIRHYPLAHSVVNVLGYVGRINKQDLNHINANNYNGSNFIGKVGIEKYYENLLHGKTGYKVAEVDANGHIVRIVKIIPPIPGNTLHLTIDSKLQQIALEALGEERGAVVAIEPQTGEILVLASNPTYNPNLFVHGIDNATFTQLQSSSSKPMYNRATKSIFPLASTIKPFVALHALDTGIINPTFKISDPGWFQVEKSNHPPYRDWKPGGHGIVNVTKAIIVSCDTFFYTLAVKMGIEKIAAILEQFGFGKKTNIDLLEESAGIIATPQWKLKHTGKRWYIGDTIISSIGQGFMGVTPLQLAQGVATIAMRGNRYQPHLLRANQPPNQEQHLQPPIPLAPITLNNPEHWNVIINAMQEVIANPMGTAHTRFGPRPLYTIAGKTGGAQLYHHEVINANEKNISKHLRNHSLFIAFAPIENPKIAIAVVVENSKIASQVARKVLDAYLTKAP